MATFVMPIFANIISVYFRTPFAGLIYSIANRLFEKPLILQIAVSLGKTEIRHTPTMKTRFLELLPLNSNALFGKDLWGYFGNQKR